MSFNAGQMSLDLGQAMANLFSKNDKSSANWLDDQINSERALLEKLAKQKEHKSFAQE